MKNKISTQDREAFSLFLESLFKNRFPEIIRGKEEIKEIQKELVNDCLLLKAKYLLLGNVKAAKKIQGVIDENQNGKNSDYFDSVLVHYHELLLKKYYDCYLQKINIYSSFSHFLANQKTE